MTWPTVGHVDVLEWSEGLAAAALWSLQSGQEYGL